MVKSLRLASLLWFLFPSLAFASVLVCKGADGEQDAKYHVEDDQFSIMMLGKKYEIEVHKSSDEVIVLKLGSPFGTLPSNKGLGYLGQAPGQDDFIQCGCLFIGDIEGPVIGRSIDRYTLESRLILLEEVSGVPTWDTMYKWREYGVDYMIHPNLTETMNRSCRSVYGETCIATIGTEVSGHFDYNSRSMCQLLQPKL